MLVCAPFFRSLAYADLILSHSPAGYWRLGESTAPFPGPVVAARNALCPTMPTIRRLQAGAIAGDDR